MTRALRDVRSERLLSARQLAARAGCAYLTVLATEHGRRTPSFETIRRLSDTLGIEPRDVTEFRRAMRLPAEGE